MMRFALLFLIMTSHAAAEPVFVSGDEDGQGFLRQRGSDCYLMTPKHVVGGAREATVVGERAERRRAILERVYDPDLAILRILGKTGCPTRFPDGGALGRLLLSDRSARVVSRSQSGTTRYTPVEIIGSDDRFILIRPASNERIFQGLSGSPLMIGGSTAGMLQSVDSEQGTGRVLRQDYMARVLKSWFPGSGGSSRPHIKNEVEPTIPTNDPGGLIRGNDKDSPPSRPAISGEIIPSRPLPEIEQEKTNEHLEEEP